MLINKKCAEKTDLASDCEFCCVCKTDHKCHVDLSPYTYDISWREKKDYISVTLKYYT